MWAEMYPDLMDGVVGDLVPAGRDQRPQLAARRAAAEAIRHDPDWKNGNYDKNPTPLHLRRRREFRDRKPGPHPGRGADPAAANALYDKRLAEAAKTGDANNSL